MLPPAPYAARDAVEGAFRAARGTVYTVRFRFASGPLRTDPPRPGGGAKKSRSERNGIFYLCGFGAEIIRPC